MINLNDKINEFINLGLRSGLFDRNDLNDIIYKLRSVKLFVDNNLPGDAFASGDGNIYINVNAINRNNNYYFLDEVLFHELMHMVNELHLDIYSNNSKFEKLEKDYSYLSQDNKLIKNTRWGVILLDEVVAQVSAQILVETKYGKKIYEDTLHKFNLMDPQAYYFSNLADYSNYDRLAEYFSNYLFNSKDNKFDLCKLSTKKYCVDQIIETFNKKDKGLENLYTVLGYMGNIAISDYYNKGYIRNLEVFNKDTVENRNKRNITLSIKKVKEGTKWEG